MNRNGRGEISIEHCRKFIFFPGTRIYAIINCLFNVNYVAAVFDLACGRR